MQKNKSRVNIFVDDSFFCGLNKETALNFKLKINKEIDEDYPVLIGDEFWTRLTGDNHFYEDLINAFAEVADDVNATEMVEETVQKLARNIEETTEED